ncbi:retroviral-like aspartic protease family protein [Candidatus Berkiella cookevillensis]|uniref:Retroviral aspartyl protease n=1 Tax=Candidatus Berkiella cookevillensis TaxID=437022 RepID=A0A0Q9YCW0_9GAMM|nr:retropepsin-like aspartic protease [Candidatus Berkiella cookevillensis]MCS5708183.1 retroviral-like aspartic protease family protein [Candidatus Berkiella cookevillensis]
MDKLPAPYNDPDDDDIPPLPEEPSHSQLGLWMAVFAWLMVIVVFSVLFDSWLAKDLSSKNTQAKITTINGIAQTIIERNVYNQYLAEGKINGKPVIFLLDTGATDVVIPGKLAQKLNLKKGYRTFANTAGGKVSIYNTEIESLVIGHIVIKHLRASINPSMHGNEVLLGMSALKHVSFTQRGNTLSLSVEP